MARLRRLQAATGIDGFKFDAGEGCARVCAMMAQADGRQPGCLGRAGARPAGQGRGAIGALRPAWTRAPPGLVGVLLAVLAHRNRTPPGALPARPQGSRASCRASSARTRPSPTPRSTPGCTSPRWQVRGGWRQPVCTECSWACWLGAGAGGGAWAGALGYGCRSAGPPLQLRQWCSGAEALPHTLLPRAAGQFSGGVSEVRTGHMTQDVAVLTRMGDRFRCVCGVAGRGVVGEHNAS